MARPSPPPAARAAAPAAKPAPPPAPVAAQPSSVGAPAAQGGYGIHN